MVQVEANTYKTYIEKFFEISDNLKKYFLSSSLLYSKNAIYNTYDIQNMLIGYP